MNRWGRLISTSLFFTLSKNRIVKYISNGVFLSRDSEDWVIVVYEKVKILAHIDLNTVTYSKPIITLNELIGICRVLNDNRLPNFNSQALISLVIEKYRPETLIYE